jgi:hypothetical protein
MPKLSPDRDDSGFGLFLRCVEHALVTPEWPDAGVKVDRRQHGVDQSAETAPAETAPAGTRHLGAGDHFDANRYGPARHRANRVPPRRWN